LGRWRRARSTGARTRDPASSFWVNTVGGPLQVCIAKKQYAKHWGKSSERVDEHTADAANRQAAAQPAAQDQARRERERAFWEQRLRPALLSAIAEKAKQQKTITRPLITAVLETITVRDDDITTWCGPIAKLPTDPERHYLIQCNESGLHGSRLAR